ncbi:MAG: TRAP transporter small permease [Proteobacteria bacterium]|nr:TRAP transporter small permease [Pseudomonadota bacterium]
MFWSALLWSDRWLLRVLKFLTGLTFAAVVLSIILGIFYRYVLKSPLSWVEEFSRLNFIWTTFLGACVATRLKEHLRIRIFSEKLGPTGAAIHQTVIACFSLVFLGVVLWYGPVVYEALSMQNYAGMPLSQKWQALSVIVGGAIMSIYFLAIIVQSLLTLARKDRPA